jgi:hypothetical protein
LLESDLPEPGTSAAPGDRVLLIPFPAPFFSIGEPVAEEMTQTLLYTPAPGQPGFALVEGVPVSYAITSDEVPEPATWLLIATALVGLLGCATIFRTQSRLREEQFSPQNMQCQGRTESFPLWRSKSGH